MASSVAKLCTVLLSFYSKLSKIIISVKKRNSRSLLAQNDIYKLVQAHWHTYMHYSRKLLMFGCAVGAPNVSLNVLKVSLLKNKCLGHYFQNCFWLPKSIPHEADIWSFCVCVENYHNCFIILLMDMLSDFHIYPLELQ
jgi:hypothetical protein